MEQQFADWQKKAALVRKLCLVATTEAGSGHPTSSLSAADIATVLFDAFFTYDINSPKHPNNDRFILSKGHASPLLYALFALSGAIPLAKLRTLRKIDSSLEGHPTPLFAHVEVATGSLGQGLSAGAGMAFALRAQVQSAKLKMQNGPRVYVLLGDGEFAEGNVWEAMNFSSYYKLDNLIAIVDVNRLGQSQETMFGYHIEEYVHRFSSCGWEVVAIDGHEFAEIKKVLDLANRNTSGKPFAIVAKTKKGKGVSFLEDKDGWHGKAVGKGELTKALFELGEVDERLRFNLRTPDARGPANRSSKFKVQSSKLDTSTQPSTPVFYKLGDEIATREVYGVVLAQLANTNPLIYALDGDVKNSTFSQDFKKVHPDRFIECFIAEQNMVGVALGLSARGNIPFVSTFASFLTRAFDQIRMAAISRANVKFVGSHAGVSIGEDGPSQMGLEDMALFGAIPDSVILHPCDATSAAKLLPLLATHVGISYLRTLRPKTNVLYKADEKFAIGGSKVLHSSKNDLLTVVAAGITVHEALKAYAELKRQHISIRVVDCYSLKPIDWETLKGCLLETKQNVLITVEDHYEHGGLGDFVLSALAKHGVVARLTKLAVGRIPRSGKKDELLDMVGISSRHIVKMIASLA